MTIVKRKNAEKELTERQRGNKMAETQKCCMNCTHMISCPILQAWIKATGTPMECLSFFVRSLIESNSLKSPYQRDRERVSKLLYAVDLSFSRGAIFSSDGKYRYALWRVWSPLKPILLYIGLNCSTAGASIDDPTVVRNMYRAAHNGYGGLMHGNLYAYISTDPGELLKGIDAVGELTDHYLTEMLNLSNGRALVGWGSFPPAQIRAPKVLKMIKEPYCLGVNKDGQPKHPLYVGYNVEMVRYVTLNTRPEIE